MGPSRLEGFPTRLEAFLTRLEGFLTKLKGSLCKIMCFYLYYCICTIFYLPELLALKLLREQPQHITIVCVCVCWLCVCVLAAYVFTVRTVH